MIHVLSQQGFPIIFHGVEGVDEREGQSPSFFNKAEIEVVVEYVLDLLNKRGGVRVRELDIGIISPYRRQVHWLPNSPSVVDQPWSKLSAVFLPSTGCCIVPLKGPILD